MCDQKRDMYPQSVVFSGGCWSMWECVVLSQLRFLCSQCRAVTEALLYGLEGPYGSCTWSVLVCGQKIQRSQWLPTWPSCWVLIIPCVGMFVFFLVSEDIREGRAFIGPTCRISFGWRADHRVLRSSMESFWSWVLTGSWLILARLVLGPDRSSEESFTSIWGFLGLVLDMCGLRGAGVGCVFWVPCAFVCILLGGVVCRGVGEF
jgi:hypothetical protein